jgi:RimJ/RimL family protein N-acetyltransferase
MPVAERLSPSLSADPAEGLPIVTPRLKLRRYVAEDAPRIAGLAGEYEVARMCGRVPHPYPLLAAEGWLMLQAAVAAAPGPARELSLAAELPGEGLIGSCGAGLAGPDGAWEIGYWFGRPWWGQGYATEAAGALMAHLRACGVARFTCGHFVDNPASEAVIRKLGFTPTHVAPYFGVGRREKAPAQRYVWPPEAARQEPAAGGH